jgi:hypothetical protein
VLYELSSSSLSARFPSSSPCSSPLAAMPMQSFTCSPSQSKGFANLTNTNWVKFTYFLESSVPCGRGNPFSHVGRNNRFLWPPLRPDTQGLRHRVLVRPNRTGARPPLARRPWRLYGFRPKQEGYSSEMSSPSSIALTTLWIFGSPRNMSNTTTGVFGIACLAR